MLRVTIAAFSLAASLAHAQPARIELHAVPTLTPTARQFLTGERGDKASLIAAELRLPQSSAGKLPAVMLMHDAAGIDAAIEAWSNELLGQGIAVLIVDSFSGRGIADTVQDPDRLSGLALLFDAYRMLERLAQHPRIDAERIAIIGFGKGALAAVYSSMARFERMYGPPNAMFAAHIGFHTPCNVSYIGETQTGNKPIRLFHGAADDLEPVAHCREFLQRLRRAERDAQLIEYAGAQRQFDVPGPASREVRGQNRGACRLEERAGGQIVSLADGKPFTPADRCVTQGAHAGYDAAAHAQAVNAVKAFLAEVFRLR